MKFKCLAFSLLASATALPGFLSGATPATTSSLGYVWTGDAGLDAGGELGSQQLNLRAAMDWASGRGGSHGIALEAGYHDYDFSGTAAPWSGVRVLGLSASWRRPAGESGMLMIVPGVRAAAASGADWGDALRFGGIASYSHRFSDTLILGIGAGVYTGLEETRAFPFLMVDWRISERWRLANPLRPGPTGPAGLELAYTLDPDWVVAVGAAWRSDRFRLDENGAVPDGVGEVEGFPAFVRLTWSVSETVTADLFAGALFSGEVTLEDSTGNRISATDLDTAPMGAVSVTARF